jgi:hypothetical protein
MGVRIIGEAAINVVARTGKVKTGFEETNKAARAMSRQMRTDMQAAKAEVQVLGQELGVHLPRAAKTFLASIPGVSRALSSAFAATAVVALGVAAFQMGAKFVEATQKARQSAKEISDAFEEMHEKASVTNSEMAVTNAKLDEQIAKLSGTRVNNLALELAESRLEADKLLASLTSANKASDEALKKNESGVAQFLNPFVFAAPSGPTNDRIKAQKKEIEDLTATYEKKQAAATSASEIDKNQAAFRTQMLDKENEQLREIGYRLGDIEQYKKNSGSSFFKEDYSVVEQSLKSRQGELQDSKISNTGRDKNLTKQKQVEDLQAAAEARELQKKASAAQMEAFERDLDALRNAHTVGVQEEHSFWLKKLDAVRLGSDNYNKIYKKLGELNQEVAKANAAAQRQDAEMVASIARQDDERIEKEMRERERLLRASVDSALQMQKEARDATREHYQEISEQSQAKVDTGEQSPGARIAMLKAASQAEQAELVSSLAKELQLRQDSLQKIKGIFGQSSDEYKLALEEQQKYLIENEDERQKVVTATNKQIADLQRQQLSEGIGGALDDMVRRAMDVQGQIKEQFEQTISSVNDTLTNMMTGEYHKGDWKKTGKQVATGVAKTGLQDAEGFALKGLGVGKLGSQGNPMWVKIWGGIESAAKDVGGAIGSVAKTTSSAGGGIGGFFGSILSSLIPKAAGGTVYPGYNYLIGEKGAEVAQFGTQGYIHSNSSLQSGGGGSGSGGDVHHHWNIDARGAHDPAAVNKAVQRGIAAAAPHIAAGAIATNRDMQKRRPSMAGG